MRISDWSSDVCSSDLTAEVPGLQRLARCKRREPDAEEVFPHRSRRRHAQRAGGAGGARLRPQGRDGNRGRDRRAGDRKRVVEGKGVAVSVDIDGRRITNKKTKTNII